MNYLIVHIDPSESPMYFLHSDDMIYRGQDSVLDAIQDRCICQRWTIDTHLSKCPDRQILLAFGYEPTIELLKANNPELLI